MEPYRSTAGVLIILFVIVVIHIIVLPLYMFWGFLSISVTGMEERRVDNDEDREKKRGRRGGERNVKQQSVKSAVGRYVCTRFINSNSKY